MSNRKVQLQLQRRRTAGAEGELRPPACAAGRSTPLFFWAEREGEARGAREKPLRSRPRVAHRHLRTPAVSRAASAPRRNRASLSCRSMDMSRRLCCASARSFAQLSSSRAPPSQGNQLANVPVDMSANFMLAAHSALRIYVCTYVRACVRLFRRRSYVYTLALTVRRNNSAT